MTLALWDPYRELEDMSEKFKRLLGKRPGHSNGEEAMTSVDWTPSVDVSETEKEYLIKAELPGVKQEEVKVSAQDGVLTIQGERKQEKEEKGKKFHRIERLYGAFERSFTLPDGVDESKVTADFKRRDVKRPSSQNRKGETKNDRGKSGVESKRLLSRIGGGPSSSGG